MPIIPSTYNKRPFYFINKHIETVAPSLLYKGELVKYKRERLELVDGDFLDLDWLRSGSKKLAVLTHGFEGSSHRHYITRPSKYLQINGWDVLSWNCRSCSEEINRLPQFYHHGSTGDLDFVVQHALNYNYKFIALVGFSMGGSLNLKYIGEADRSDLIKAVVSFSTPCNLNDSARQLKQKGNWIYEDKFIRKIKKKIKIKTNMFPDIYQPDHLGLIKDFKSFHELYSHIFYGCRTIGEFHEDITCDKYFDGIKVPTLIANAKNDPLLTGGCYPIEFASSSTNVFLEMPEFGGHVGFTLSKHKWTWMEYRLLQFLEEHI